MLTLRDLWKPKRQARTNAGVFNDDYEESRGLWLKGNSYRDLSTVWVVVSRGQIPTRVVQSWWCLIKPPNQKFMPVMIEGAEVGHGYNAVFHAILNHPQLKDYPYVFTTEEDNLPPPDALLKLYESIATYDIVGGLYWMKTESGFPVCFGDPAAGWNVRPIVPPRNAVTPVNMVGMGCTLWRTEVFRKIPPPWFETIVDVKDDGSCLVTTQDAPFFQKAHAMGIRTAVDTRVLVGHLDVGTGIVW